MKKVKLIPPDKNQCQAELINGSFMSFGIPSRTRCTKKPGMIIQEKKAPHGSMSVCPGCFTNAVKLLGDTFKVRPL